MTLKSLAGQNHKVARDAIIQSLENALEEARNGTFTELLMVMSPPDYHPSEKVLTFLTCANVYKSVGFLELLKHDLLRSKAAIEL